MLSQSLVTLISIILYIHLSAALPFNARDSKPAYSIVNVDGSNGSNPTSTVTQIHTVALATVTETVLVTVTVKEAIASETMIPTPSSQIADQPASPTLLSSDSSSSSSEDPPTTTINVDAMRTASAMGLTTSYDDGYWHTSYTGDVSPSLVPSPAVLEQDVPAQPASASQSASFSISPDFPALPSDSPAWKNETQIPDIRER
jgi:hypothetical protein